MDYHPTREWSRHSKPDPAQIWKRHTPGDPPPHRYTSMPTRSPARLVLPGDYLVTGSPQRITRPSWLTTLPGNEAAHPPIVDTSMPTRSPARLVLPGDYLVTGSPQTITRPSWTITLPGSEADTANQIPPRSGSRKNVYNKYIINKYTKNFLYIFTFLDC